MITEQLARQLQQLPRQEKLLEGKSWGGKESRALLDVLGLCSLLDIWRCWVESQIYKSHGAIDDYRYKFQGHSLELIFKALGKNKCDQTEKGVIPTTKDWNTTTFRRRNKKRKSCQRVRKSPGDCGRLLQITSATALFPNKVTF